MKVKRGRAGECWEWASGRYPTGYGMFNIGRALDGKQHTDYAHRIAYVLACGPIPSGSPRMVVMHACDNPPCCNPAHLRLGTQSDNLTDASRKGRVRRAA